MGLFDYPAQSADANAWREPPAFTFLDNLPAASWKKIIAQAETVRYLAGQMIVRAGERDDAFYIVSAGTVEVVVPGADGERVLASIPEGSVFGEIAFFDGEPRSASIRATTNVSALRITREGFDRLSGWDPALARAVIMDLGKILAMRLRWTTALTQT